MVTYTVRSPDRPDPTPDLDEQLANLDPDLTDAIVAAAGNETEHPDIHALKVAVRKVGEWTPNDIDRAVGILWSCHLIEMVTVEGDLNDGGLGGLVVIMTTRLAERRRIEAQRREATGG